MLKTERCSDTTLQLPNARQHKWGGQFGLGLLARRTLVYTVLAPQGIDWGNGETATLIFVLAISKADYEEAMGLYDLFLALMNEKASRSLLACRDFAAFKALARSAP